MTGVNPRAISFAKTRTWYPKTNKVQISSVNSVSSLYYFLVGGVPTTLRKGPAGLGKIPTFPKNPFAAENNIIIRESEKNKGTVEVEMTQT